MPIWYHCRVRSYNDLCESGGRSPTRYRMQTARIAVDEGELERLPDLTLTSGMPVEAFIQTGERTALSYLTKPIAGQFMRSFRSD